jgi:hypothetical protein
MLTPVVGEYPRGDKRDEGAGRFRLLAQPQRAVRNVNSGVDVFLGGVPVTGR